MWFCVVDCCFVVYYLEDVGELGKIFKDRATTIIGTNNTVASFLDAIKFLGILLGKADKNWTVTVYNLIYFLPTHNIHSDHFLFRDAWCSLQLTENMNPS